LARGFIKTGLGARIAYYFVLNMGKSTLGLAYGLITTELLLAPFTPSNTARGAGIVYPIVAALSQEYGSSPSKGTSRKMGAYLMQLAYQANVITSAMFLTATAGNPLIASLAAKMGFEITWTSWALAAIVPGVLSLGVMPLILYQFYPPEIKHTPEAPLFAAKKLSEMGSIRINEWIMLATFGLLLVLWVFGAELGVDATVAALLGLAILLATGVLNWDDILKEQNAWHTFIWLTTLLMMSNFLTEFGMMSWFSDHMQTVISPFHWISALTAICLLYFYSHYGFASMTAHISSMYGPFALVAIAAGAPPMMTIFLLAFLSSLCASITHYGTGTAPVYFGSDYVSLRDWWRLGAIMSVVNISIWVIAGTLWWKIIGLW
jgi:divalent anion:Na+ symporter, DASS family